MRAAAFRTWSLAWLLFLGAAPLAALQVVAQIAFAQTTDPTASTIEEGIARLLAMILTGAGIPAAVVSVLLTTTVAVCRFVSRSKSGELRLTIGKRQLLIALGDVPADPLGTPRSATDEHAETPAVPDRGPARRMSWLRPGRAAEGLPEGAPA